MTNTTKQKPLPPHIVALMARAENDPHFVQRTKELMGAKTVDRTPAGYGPRD